MVKSMNLKTPAESVALLTRRELYAAMAMQGIRSVDVEDNWSIEKCAEVAVKQADALIAELGKKK